VDKKIVYIIEFKVILTYNSDNSNKANIEFFVIEKKEEKGKALKQIREKEYHKKYLNYEKIYLVGIEFDRVKKDLVNFEYEIVK